MSDKDTSKVFKDMLGKLLGTDNVPDDAVITATLNDNRLMKLAEYDLTKGYTYIKIENEDVQKKFTEFKNLVMAKSSTLAELETAVFSKYGVLEKARANAPVNQTNTTELNDVTFAEHKPIMGFATSPEKTNKKKGKTNG